MLSPHVPDLAALQVLAAVDEAGSMRGAAALVGVTQQAMSLRMRSIEAQVGVALLVRTTHGSHLTPAGRLLTQWGSRVLAAAAELDAGIDSLRSDRQDHLRVVASLTVAEHLLPGWLVALRTAQQQSGAAVTDVRLEATNSENVVAAVRDGDADVGFVEGPSAPRGLRSRVVAHDRLVVVVAPAHPWARRRRPVAADELARTPLVSREAGSGTRRALVRALAAHLPTGAALAPPALELSSTTAVRAAVSAGAAPGALSALAVADDVALGRLVEVPVPDVDLSRRLRAVWRDSPQPPAGPVRQLVALAAGRG